MTISSLPLTNAFARIDLSDSEKRWDEFFGSYSVSSLKEQFGNQNQSQEHEVVENKPAQSDYYNSEIGLSFQYPSEWKKPLDVNLERCKLQNECVLSFTFYLFLQNPKNRDPSDLDYSDIMKFYFITIQATNLQKPRNFSDPCNCTNLDRFVAWDYRTDYDRIFKEQKYLKDNLTTLKNNRSAWQMETENEDLNSKYLVVWMVNSNIGYRFIYYGPSGDYFAKYLGGFKEVLNSLNFTDVFPNRMPSFLKDNNFTTGTEDLVGQNGTIRITSSSNFIDNSGYFHVVGEVENHSPANANFVKVVGTFYDSSNNVVGTEYAYTNPATIGLGQIAPFELILTSSSVPTSLIHHYKLSITT